MGFYRLPKIIGKGNKPSFGARINWNHPLSQGLVWAWLFNEGGGNIVYENILGVKGNLISGPPFCPEGLDLTSDSDYVNAGIDARWEVTRPNFSAVWKITMDGTVTNPFGHLNHGSGSTGWYINSIVSSGYFDINVFIYCSSGSASSWTPNKPFSTTGIYQFAFTHRSGEITKLNANGRNYSMTGATDAVEWPSSQELKLGYQNLTGSVKSKLHFFYFYGRELTQEEIISLYANPYQMFEWPVGDYYFVPAAAPPPTGGKSIFGYDSIFHAGGIIQT